MSKEKFLVLILVHTYIHNVLRADRSQPPTVAATT